jgi:hypothetical protein
MLLRNRTQVPTKKTPAIAARAQISQTCVCRAAQQDVLDQPDAVGDGQEVGGSADGRHELVRRQHEPAEEHRSEEDEQR